MEKFRGKECCNFNLLIMNSKIISLVLVLIMTILKTNAQEQKVITGELSNKSGDKISNAIVTLEQTEDYAISDENGKFKLTLSQNLESVTVKVSHLNYAVIKQKINFSKSNAQSIQLTLKNSSLEEIIVEDNLLSYGVNSKVVIDNAKQLTQARNVADLFQDIPGFNLSKKGSYAIDPIFRSFKHEQLNIQYDGGVKVMHACPNRMDPITTHVIPEEIQKMEIIKGPYSVRYGSTFGGLVNINTQNATKNLKLGWSGSVESAYETNGGSYIGRVLLGLKKEKYDLLVNGEMRNFGDYTDGNGTVVPSSFESYDYSAKFGFHPFKNHHLQLTWRQSYAKNIDHVTLPMDSPMDNSTVAALDYKITQISKVLSALRFKAYYSFVDHRMDNFSRKNFSAVEAVSTPQSTTTGGRLELTIIPSKKTVMFVGLDYNGIARVGNRERLVKKLMKPDTTIIFSEGKMFVDSIWQNSVINTYGAFWESNFFINPKFTIKSGLRVDLVTSEIKEPASDFTKLYEGTDFQQTTQTNFSAFVTANYKFSKKSQLELSIGRGVRSPNMIERYINHFSVGLDPYELVGNPNLKPEANHQIDLSYAFTASKKFRFGINTYYSYITNLITAQIDSTVKRKFMPWVKPTVAKVFYNADAAMQTGLEFFAEVQLAKSLKLGGTVSYVYAQNLELDESLPHIPPLNGILRLNYTKEKYWMDLRWRIVTEQNQYSTSFGEKATPGFNTLDFRVGVKPMKKMSVGAAALNILDVAYYEHTNFSYKNQPANLTGPLYEAGRNFTFFVKYNF